MEEGGQLRVTFEPSVPAAAAPLSFFLEAPPPLTCVVCQRARWWIVQHFAHRARYLVLHDATADNAHAPFFIPSEQGDQGGDQPGLFAAARLYRSKHCRGPGTAVLTMRHDCALPLVF